MDFNLIKRKLLKYWIRVYYYNNELILWLKRNCRKSSNLLLLLLSPYIFMKAGLYAIYERVWGKYVVARKITKGAHPLIDMRLQWFQSLKMRLHISKSG